MLSEFLYIGTLILISAAATLYFRRRSVADVDVKIFQLYLLRIMIISGSIGVLLLFTATILGIEAIKTDIIWLYLLITMFALSIGAILVKRK